MTYRGKHRKASTASRNIARVAVAGMAVGAPFAIAATPAQASSGTNWDAVAQCESGGNWSTSTGNGFSGGLQFTPSTWKAYGGSGSPQNASRSEQIAVAEKVKEGQGMGAWPNCGKHAGSSSSKKSSSSDSSSSKKKSSSSDSSSSKKKSSSSDSSSSKKSSSSKQSTATPKSNPNGDYTVKAGDTLSKISKEANVEGGYQKLKQLNKGYVPNADVITIGQKLATK